MSRTLVVMLVSITRSPIQRAVMVGLAALAATTLAPAAVAASPPARSFIRSAGPVDAPRTLILVHGGPGLDSQFTFRGLKSLASSSRRVVAFDQRGVGRTPMPQTGNRLNTDYTIDAFVTDLEALRVRLGVARIDVLGHSFGALLAAAYAARHPTRVRSLILASALPMSVEAQFEGDARFEKRLQLLQRRGLVPKVVPDTCAERNRALLPVYLGDPTRARAIGLALGSSRCDDLVGSLVNDAIISDPRRGELSRTRAGYRGPALVVIGARDPFGAIWADDAAEPFGDARLTKRILPHAGHLLWLESPRFMPLVESFLART